MGTKALAVYAGREAAAQIEKNGWNPELFSLLLGASGGPKWLILSHLDRILFGDFLQRSDHRFSVMGSSIGSWRHACLAMADPVAALDRFEENYILQDYETRPSAEQVSAASLDILKRVLGESGAAQIVGHPRVSTHIVTARGRGPTASTSTGIMATGMGAAALGNAVSRQLLKLAFQRVVFHSGPMAKPQLSLHDFDSCFVTLDENNLAPALHASGSIPFVLTGERDIPRAPPGQYWDGGIIDYHFDLAQFCGEGLVLYPHFSASITPGWFDKHLAWRRTALQGMDKLVLLCPSDEFIAGLPHGKIPDRNDFTRFNFEQRARYWQDCIEQNKALAEDFSDLIQQDNPLAGVTVF
ncbi:MAG: patatin-like phospholipase family protein [Proteobacteria bacterium]|nr:patatin-like phospholipase family protein [Pseudomonadota bacterium]